MTTRILVLAPVMMLLLTGLYIAGFVQNAYAADCITKRQVATVKHGEYRRAVRNRLGQPDSRFRHLRFYFETYDVCDQDLDAFVVYARDGRRFYVTGVTNLVK